MDVAGGRMMRQLHWRRFLRGPLELLEHGGGKVVVDGNDVQIELHLVGIGSHASLLRLDFGFLCRRGRCFLLLDLVALFVRRPLHGDELRIPLLQPGDSDARIDVIELRSAQ